MVIAMNKNGKPKRTVDYQHLNSQCKQETHHTSSSLQLRLQVPSSIKKCPGCRRWLPLNPPRLTTFITECGHFMYLRMFHGYLASGDIYTCWYDEIIKNVPHKVKIVDILLFTKNIEEAIYHTLDYLLLCKKKMESSSTERNSNSAQT